ncbi:MAG: glutamate--tRNA ligase [Mycoplasmatales bacterium]
MNNTVVRYPPSPTGHLHIGNARTALFNYLFAKHYNGKFVIRIEDTDTKRNIEDGEKSQLENLTWLGIDWTEGPDIGGDHGPYRQLERFEQGIYQQYVDKLLESKQAYRCFCTSEHLDQVADKQKADGQIPKYDGTCKHLSDSQIKENLDNDLEYTVRFSVPENTEYTFDDIVKGNVTFNSKDISGDFNILKRDGIPTYNFAVAIDDALMKVTHVLRGEDHISNTPKQMMIYQALNLDMPTFGHMTLIVNEDGKKLSKRDESILQFIENYKDYGYLPEAMFNFISLFGWSPEGEEEIFTWDELIEKFDP